MADELAEQVLVFIADYIGDHGFGPTVREICDACDIGSTATAHRRLQLLAEEGRISFLPMSPRTIRLLPPTTVKGA